MRREPEKVVRNPGEQRTYDSVKVSCVKQYNKQVTYFLSVQGNISGRNEFVVYNAYRVMPEYMIEYTFTVSYLLQCTVCLMDCVNA